MGATVSVSAGQDVTGIVMKLSPQAVIAGKVLDEDGDPVPYAQVMVLKQRYMRGKRQWMPSGGGQVNDLGEFRVSGLQPGRYLVAASSPRNGIVVQSAPRSGPKRCWSPPTTPESPTSPRRRPSKLRPAPRPHHRSAHDQRADLSRQRQTRRSGAAAGRGKNRREAAGCHADAHIRRSRLPVVPGPQHEPGPRRRRRVRIQWRPARRLRADCGPPLRTE